MEAFKQELHINFRIIPVPRSNTLIHLPLNAAKVSFFHPLPGTNFKNRIGECHGNQITEVEIKGIIGYRDSRTNLLRSRNVCMYVCIKKI